MANSKKTCFYLVALLLQLFFISNLQPRTIGFQGQLTAWTLTNPEQSYETLLGLRYLPELSGRYTLSGSHTLDANIELDTYGIVFFKPDKTTTDSRLKLYRASLRYASTRFEARIGLQKINFGSAALLRPLMWFNRLDPRDPLQLTDGVYGLLLRYYLMNNANIWLWGLIGNQDTRGWEVVPTAEKKPEWGGRIQYPVPAGEIAISMHHREIDIVKGINSISALPGLPSSFVNPDMIPAQDPVSENRIGFDGKWDIEIGFWTEAALIHQDIDWMPYKYQRMINVGADYTFGLGNGLHTLYEHFWYDMAEKASAKGEGLEFSALSASYPIGLMDQISGMLYYDWENSEWYRFINYQRTYDNLMIYIIGFWNPEQFQIYQTTQQNSLFAGKGFQLMLVFNH